jgi:hypothetical protein
MNRGDDDDGSEEEGRRKRLKNGREDEDDVASSSSSSVDPLDGLKRNYLRAFDALEVARMRLLNELDSRRQRGDEVEFDYKELRDMLPSMNALVAAPSSSSSSEEEEEEEEESVAPVVAVGYSSRSTDGEKTIVYSELSLDKVHPSSPESVPNNE